MMIKRTVFFLFLPALLFVLASCIIPSDNLLTVSGTVTITRNGIPWNSDNFSPYYGRDVGPPEDRPIIYAYSKDGDLMNRPNGYYGEAAVYYKPDDDSYRSGTYQWKLKIPSDKLPASFYFDVTCNMPDVQSVFRTKLTKEYLVQDENTIVDIGIVNFDVVRLSGNLPVTINNIPLEDYNDYGNYSSGMIYVFNLTSGIIVNEEPYPSWTVNIDPDGGWFLNIERPVSEISLLFMSEAHLNGGILRKILNDDYAITVYDADKEIFFPNYPSVNYEAFHLSGTIEAVSPGNGESRFYAIKFFSNDDEFTGNNYSIESNLLSEISTGWSASGRKSWKTTIPALELPHELFYSFSFYKGSKMYYGHSSIMITSDTDLSSIDLGVFNFK